ncbi:hypothetical protein LCGC14_1766440 [marine sediment metagenome]|uniref:Uncharacterized protein n=1 Tax=marine sediment metagenome TaxID=412755 RepID=A0A0F9JZ80_9ZZZZ
MIEDWEQGSEETRESLAKGHGITFPSGEEVINWLTDGGRMTDSLRQPSPLKNVSTVATGGADSPEVATLDERVREEIAELARQVVHPYALEAVTPYEKHAVQHFISFGLQILSIIKEAGYIQLDPDQSLPKNPYMDGTATELGWQNGVEDMLKDNWKKVKEERND